MATVYFGLGSNIEPRQNLLLGIGELRRRFGKLELSNVYRNRPVGFEGNDFFNLVAGADTDASPASIHEQIEAIHELAGRQTGEEKFSDRPLDIDLLLHGEQILDEPPLHLPRADILEYSFVLRPLAELAPDHVHPLTGHTLAHHWQAFDQTSHPLEIATDIL